MTTKVSAALIAARNMPKQTALFGNVDANGYANFLTTGSGLRPGLLATSVELALSYANGLAENVEQITADVTDILGSNLPASNTSFVYKTLGGAYASTLVPPQYGYAFDRTKGALLNFDGVDGSTSMIDAFGNTWTAGGNAQIDTAQSKFGGSSLLLDGTGDYITSSSYTSHGDGSWEVSMWFRINALPGVGTNAMLFQSSSAVPGRAQLILANTAGTTRLVLALDSGANTNDIGSPNGTNTTWALNQWNKVRFVFDALAGTYKAFLSLNGAAETTDISHASAVRIGATTTWRVGGDNSGAAGFNGWIDAFYFLPCVTNAAAETPSVSAPTITSHPVHWFSIPEMKMYEVTSASVSAGTNPGMTQRNRLFLGEADTSGAAVTAARTYALRGKYKSALTAMPAVATTTVFNANLGVQEGVKARMIGRCIAGGTETGFEVGIVSSISTGECVPAEQVRPRGNTIAVIAAGNGGGNMAGLSGGVIVSMASNLNFKFYVEAERTW
jgi:hypothetical protein